jgi:UDP-glucose 4-epimerase
LRRDAVPCRAAIRGKTGAADSATCVSVGDIGAETDWHAALHGVQGVVHLAARVHVMDECSADPLAEFRRVNVAGTLNLARQAAAAGVQRFIFLSSVKVNGEMTRPGRAFTATDAPAPEDPYGISKLEAEQGLRQIEAQTGMAVVIVRPPLIYGPGVKANFARMIRWVARGLPLPLGAVTENRRSLVALDNLVDLLALCLTHPAAVGQTFMVSDGEDLSTASMLRRLALAMGKTARLMPLPVALLEFGARLVGRQAMAQRLLGSLQVDSRPTCERLGWRPPLSVDQALAIAVRGEGG